jgi:hypothetical protein
MKKVGNHNSITRKLFLGAAFSLIFFNFIRSRGCSRQLTAATVATAALLQQEML